MRIIEVTTDEFIEILSKKYKPKKYSDIAKDAAKLIRKELKEYFPKIKFKVRSITNYAAGGYNAVDVFYNDENTFPDDVSKIIDKYRRGRVGCDPYNDNAYDVDNYREDVPQVKFLSITNFNVKLGGRWK